MTTTPNLPPPHQPDLAATGNADTTLPPLQPRRAPRDPQRVPPGLRKFARATAAPVNRVLHPVINRNW
jgi:hypothetical protein